MIVSSSGPILKCLQDERKSILLKQNDLLIHRLLNFGISTNDEDPGIKQDSLIEHLSNAELDQEIIEASRKDKVQENQIDSKIKKFIRSRIYNLKPDSSNNPSYVRSWTMLEHIYRLVPSPFPTLARGLFTQEDADPSLELGQGRHRIVARGYDKFFNIDELPSTKWDALAARTEAPYHLTLKTNGCIIFIAALSPNSLLVTSKHATNESNPDQTDIPMTHSVMGEKWLDRHLQSVGLERAQLAQELWAAQATAVAELTDDSFEEHVIATPAAEIGLNLHGININTTPLLTYQPEIVASCAKRWGMHPTPYKTVHSIEAAREECEEIKRHGWPGRDGLVEGVVVRGTPAEQQSPTEDSPSSSVFWKVKFEEPYLLYREWRELTRKILSEAEKLGAEWESTSKSSRSQNSLSAFESERLARLLKVNVKRIQTPETRLYVHWVISEFLQRPQTFSQWKENRGIIEARETFFEWRQSPGASNVIDKLGAEIQPDPQSAPGPPNQKFDKTVLAPIAIPGCGKTTLAVALSGLIRCSHTQSDNIQTKKTGPMFISSIKNLLLEDSTRIVFADKNNHLKTHRKALVDLVGQLKKGIEMKRKTPGGKRAGVIEPEFKQVTTRLVAIVWDLDRYSKARIHQMACDRIMKRGDNHQSLRPERMAGGTLAHDTILRRFLHEIEQFDSVVNSEDQLFHEVIELKFTDPVEESLKTLVKRLGEICPEEMADADLSPSEIEKAVSMAKNYRVEVKKQMKVDSKRQEARYFGIRLQVDLESTVNKLFERASDQAPVDTTFLDQLNQLKAFIQVPHVTLLHQNEVESKPELKQQWDYFRTLVCERFTNVEVEVGPKLVWNERVMVMEARFKTVRDLSPMVNQRDMNRCHVTIGTLDESIRPIEGRVLLDHFFDNFNDQSWIELNKVKWINIEPFNLKGVLSGLT